MSTPQQQFQQFLDAQRREYGRSLPDEVSQIDAQWRLAAAGTSNGAPLAQLERLAHTLAGTAGTLGFVATGQAAKALELLLQQGGQTGPVGAGLHAEITRAIGCLQGSLPVADSASTDLSAETPTHPLHTAKDAG